MLEKLNAIKNVKASMLDKHKLSITNQSAYSAVLESESIESTEFITAPAGDKGLKMWTAENHFLIVLPDNYIFTTRNTGLFQVTDLPEVISLSDIISISEKYIAEPEPTNNIDNTIARYLLCKTLLENAELYNFDVSQLKKSVRHAALSTDAIGDLTIYD